MKRKFLAATYICFLPGLAFLLITFYLYSTRYSFFENANETNGTITKFIPAASKNGTVYYPYISFVTKSRQQVEFTSCVEKKSFNNIEGSKVKVFYDPTNPEKAEINGMYVFSIDPLFFGFLGMFFFLIGFWIIFGEYRKRKKK
ncbi:DUF3592 domain-containing protein [Flavobacterium hercynium]|uniref:DUF3592 domain-containing protein n=1 Tax=Flavobacterium hercynium TaxID=387094 RepID=A0A226HI20_9FLAO|nr:DUF3592 domain-containing protein [Flavobacterium hercynium]OXA93754.1 hypothetical protein B0A66_05740 [Flavobacterium hercynium]SMP20646.1 Protein of unknown function [Flavobacterium hercynium]